MLTQTIKVLALLFIIALLFTYSFQRYLIYIPSTHHPLLDDFGAHDLRVLTLHTKDNLSLNAWYKPAQLNNPTILYLHGNAGNIGNRMPSARQFIQAGFGILLLEYRGYGGNKGSPTEQGLYEDGRTALAFLAAQNIKNSQLVLYGESLGTGVASQLATEHPSCALILQSPFTSLSSIARYHYPWIPLSPWDKYDSLSRMGSINTPLLVLHGTQDRTIPYREGSTLFNAAKKPKQMVSFAGYDHHNLSDAPDFYPQVIHFIKHHCS
jgi:uncharacterized protein